MKIYLIFSLASLARVALPSVLQQPLSGELSAETDSTKTSLDRIIVSSPLLSFHRDIVRISSISDHERNVGEFVLDFLSAHNFTVEKQIVQSESESQDERFNIYAYIGENRHPDILLTSHIDTVPPFIPYSLHAPAGKGSKFHRADLLIAGRGTVDAKGSVAAIVFAALETLNEAPDASIGLLFDVGEENSGAGMKHFSDSDLNPSPASFHTIIFGEPTELSLVAGHKGTFGFKVIAEGKAAHSGYPWLGKSAISSILPVLSLLDTLEDVPPEQGGLLRSDVLGNSTLNIGVVNGGVAGNVVPAHVEASVKVRLAAGNPSNTEDIVKKAVKNFTTDSGVSVVFERGSSPQLFDTDVGGFNVITVNYGTDAASLKIHDREDRKVRRYLYGPGSIHVAHGDDEAITVGELEEAVQGYKRLISAAL
ncbi:Peptidase M20 [Penicillium argentinense]|uniref:Peptidase M20 n=1 Tax=Penicillium argentinense TaxID=1131581 RepID=A0A9W9F7Q4_9EURO|nr:Peptidase M20 [Penicillium argentinense]KAJ5095123.1 Peptidase M20 [Penicillium argentinense]